MERKDLEPFVTYYDEKDDMYFWSPDGVSGYWYATLEECEEEHGAGKIIVVDEILDY